MSESETTLENVILSVFTFTIHFDYIFLTMNYILLMEKNA